MDAGSSNLSARTILRDSMKRETWTGRGKLKTPEIVAPPPVELEDPQRPFNDIWQFIVAEHLTKFRVLMSDSMAQIDQHDIITDRVWLTPSLIETVFFEEYFNFAVGIGDGIPIGRMWTADVYLGDEALLGERGFWMDASNPTTSTGVVVPVEESQNSGAFEE